MDKIGILIAQLNDPNEGVRLAIIKVLGKIGSARAEEALIAQLSDNSADVRREAVEALGNIGNEVQDED